MTTLYEPPRDMKEPESTIGGDSRIRLGFLVTIVVCAVPLVASYIAIRSELSGIRSELNVIRRNMGDRWSASMMILWTDRLKYENSGKLVVPDVNRVREDMPLPQNGS